MSKRLVIVALLAALAVALFPTGAALGASPADPIIVVDECTLHVEFNAQSTGPYEIWIWDDGKVVLTQSASGAAGDTLVFDLMMTVFGEFAQGVGLAVMKDGSGLYYTEIPQITALCNASLARACMPTLTGGVVGQITKTTPAYYAPSLDAQTTTVLPVGQTWWVLGTDEFGDWYKLLVACEDVWVPASALGPNFDAVWTGTSLPSNIVE